VDELVCLVKKASTALNFTWNTGSGEVIPMLWMFNMPVEFGDSDIGIECILACGAVEHGMRSIYTGDMRGGAEL
jgi:hypothetical protein